MHTSTADSSYFQEHKSFHINTLHRGRFIQIILISLFTIGIFSSFIPLNEIVKIILLLLMLPILLFVAVKFSQQPSVWIFSTNKLNIQKGGKVQELSIADISHIRNHIRSGGNLIVIYLHHKKTPLRYWRNKLFQANDDCDAFFHYIKDQQIPYMIG